MLRTPFHVGRRKGSTANAVDSEGLINSPSGFRRLLLEGAEISAAFYRSCITNFYPRGYVSVSRTRL